jgi:hypothetical protein
MSVNSKHGDPITDEEHWFVRHVVSRSMHDIYVAILRSQRIEGLWDEKGGDEYIPSETEDVGS